MLLKAVYDKLCLTINQITDYVKKRGSLLLSPPDFSRNCHYCNTNLCTAIFNRILRTMYNRKQ